jgi:hypothetical protein
VAVVDLREQEQEIKGVPAAVPTVKMDTVHMTAKLPFEAKVAHNRQQAV